MKKYTLQEGTNVGKSGTNTGTGNSRHERTQKRAGTISGLVSDTSLAGENTNGVGTGNSRYISARSGTAQVIDSGRSLRTNSATPDKGSPDLIGKVVAVARPKRRRY